MANKKQLFQILKWIVSLGLLVWLYLSVDWATFAALLKNASPVFLFIGLFLTLLNTILCAYKWKLFLKADLLDQKLPYLVSSYWIGSFVSLFLPSNIGGDAYKVVDVGNKTKETVRSFTSVFADRFTGFLALSIIGFAGSIYGFQLIHRIEISLILLGFLGLLTIITILLFDPRWVRLSLKITKLDRVGAIHKTYESFVQTLHKYGGKPKLVVSTMALSFAFHFTYITIVFCYSRFLGLEIAYAYFILFVPIIAIFEALPISVYGIGVRDSAYVFFFSMAGMQSEHALALALVFVVTNVIYASIGGILLLLRK